MSQLRIGGIALTALACAAGQAAPNLVMELTLNDFTGLADNTPIMAWTNHVGVKGVFLPVGTGAEVVYNTSVGGIPAVTFRTRSNANGVMTNRVSTAQVSGTKPWGWEIWVLNPSLDAGAEGVFTWTTRTSLPSPAEGTCMEFRYGSDAANAVERYGGNQNLRWAGYQGGGTIPTANQWHHIAVMRDAASGIERLYVDGSLRDHRFVTPAAIRDSGLFTLGAVQNGSNWDNLFSGSIARLRIYDGPLSWDEVVQNYQAEYQAFFGTTPPAPAPSTLGINRFWNGTQGTWQPWGTAANWALNTLPVDNNNVYIDNGGGAVWSSGTNTFAQFYGHNGGFEMLDGLITVQNTVQLANVPGRTFDFRVKGGKFNVPGSDDRHFYMGDGYVEAYIGGGSEQAWLCVDKDIQLGRANGGYGYMEVLQNGLVTISNGYFYVNYNVGGTTGKVVVAGGTIRAERGDRHFVVGQGRGAKATLVVNSGKVGPFSEMRLSGDVNDTKSQADVFLNGGVIEIYRFIPYQGVNNIWLNGGTLRNRDSRTGSNADNGFLWGQTAAYVQGGGAVFDVIPNTTIDVTQPLVAGPDGLNGGLTKLNSGTLILKGANTFKGDITVSGGNLLFRNASGLPGTYSGTIFLQNGAGIGWEVAGGASALLARIDKNSVGTLLLFNTDTGANLNLSQHPNLSLGFAGQNGTATYGGTLSPIAGTYRFTAFGDWGNRGIISSAISGNANIVMDASSTGFLSLTGDNNGFTGNITVDGGVLAASHNNAFGLSSSSGSITLNNGGGIMIDANMGASAAQAIVNRITPNSRGAVVLSGASGVTGFALDLSGLPWVSLGAESNRDYNPNPANGFIPDSTTGYHVGGGRNAWGNSGIGLKNLTDGAGGRKMVLSYPGTARVITNNVFSGGIVVSNNATLWFDNDTALGAVPPTPRADSVLVNGGGFRPNYTGNIPYWTTGANYGLTVADGGMMLYMPGSRYWAWNGDLNGTGAITNWDSGIIMFGGANNTWKGTLTFLNGGGTFAVGFGNNFSWDRDNIITGDNGFFGVATDLDISWTNKFAQPLGYGPVSAYAPDGKGANIGLRKLGAGTLTLDTASTYRRDTIVESGTLKVGVQDAIPWGTVQGVGNRGNLHVIKGNVFPGGVLDINGFDVNVNGFNGAGTVLDSTGAGKTLTIGNQNQVGTFYGTVLPPAKIYKVGDGLQTFYPGASLGDFTALRRSVTAGPNTSFGAITLQNNDTGNEMYFNVGLTATDAYGLTGEYYNFDFPWMQPLVRTNVMTDLTAFETLLASYTPAVVQSSFSFGKGFDAGYTGGGGPGSLFQGGYNNRSYHYCRWFGEFYAETDGEYAFATLSDDGSVVYIDRQLVVDNDRDGGYTTPDRKRDGKVTLEQGWHDILIGYYQKTTDRGLTVFMTPPGGEEAVLPQTLLRPYPVRAKALAAVPRSTVWVHSNASLVVACDTVNVYSGKLFSVAKDARFIKEGPGDFLFVGQQHPLTNFNGQIIVAEGDLGLMDAAPTKGPIIIEGGGVFYARPDRTDWPNSGLWGGYYNTGNYGAQATLQNLIDRFAAWTPDYVFHTSQAGPDAVLGGAANFYYDNGAEFPGPYSNLTPPAGDRINFQMLFKGKFLVLESGWYTFALLCDDRGDLFLNSERICADATYNGEKISAPRFLEAGTHDFQIGCGQGSGGYYVRLRVAATLGGTFIKMPNAWLRPSVSKAYRVEGALMDLRYQGSYLCMQIEEPQEFPGTIIGAPGSEIEKNGAATWTLTGDNDGFEGGWLVLKGDLIVGDGDLNGTLGGKSVYISEGARLIFNRSDDIVYEGTISGKGQIISLGGSVTFPNFGDGFKGTFGKGEFIAGGPSVVLQPSQIGGDARVYLADGATLLIPQGTDPDLSGIMGSVGFADGTLVLPFAEGNTTYKMDSLYVEAGTTFQVGVNAPGGLYGRYYAISSFSHGIVATQFFAIATAEEYLKTNVNATFLGRVSSWEAGPNFDFGSGTGGGTLDLTNLKFPTLLSGTRYENFIAIYKGKIKITVPGTYTFATTSDDESMLFINGNLVVDNNWNHGMQTRTGQIVLAAGLHDIVILFGQGGTGLGLYVDITVPGESPKRLPNDMLIADPADFGDVLVKGVPLADISGMTFSLEVGTLGVVRGPGTGTVDVTGGGLPISGSLAFSNLFIESPGAVIATKGSTSVKGDLHVVMPAEPPRGKMTLIGDFTQAPLGLALFNKANSTLDCPKGKLVYKGVTRTLYVSTSEGTVMILR